jgi:hypothetical protein
VLLLLVAAAVWFFDLGAKPDPTGDNPVPDNTEVKWQPIVTDGKWRAIHGHWSQTGETISVLPVPKSASWSHYELDEELTSFRATMAIRIPPGTNWAGFAFCGSRQSEDVHENRTYSGYRVSIHDGHPELIKHYASWTGKILATSPHRPPTTQWDYFSIKVRNGSIVIQRSQDNLNYTTLFDVKDNTFRSGRLELTCQEGRTAEFKVLSVEKETTADNP